MRHQLSLSIITLLMFAVMPALHASGFMLGMDTLQQDIHFNSTVSANGTTYGIQRFDDSGNTAAISAGYEKTLDRITLSAAFSARSYHYKTGKGAAASADISTNNATVAAQQAIIDTEESSATPDDAVIQAATSLRDDAITKNANIESAHNRSESVKSIVVGARMKLYGSPLGWQANVGGKLFAAIDGNDYARDYTPVLEIGITKQQFTLAMLGGEDGVSVAAGLVF